MGMRPLKEKVISGRMTRKFSKVINAHNSKVEIQCNNLGGNLCNLEQNCQFDVSQKTHGAKL